MRCDACRGTGLAPAHDKRWLVMDCTACQGRGGPPETLEEQAARLRQRVADLERQLEAQGRELRETRDEQNAALWREGVMS